MTPEDLQRLVTAGKPVALAEALAGLDEKERRSLSKTAATLLRQASRQELLGDEGVRRWIAQRPDRSSREAWLRTLGNAGLAVLGVGPLSRAKRVEFLPHDETLDSVVKVLGDRRPSWASEWLEHRLEKEWPGLAWSTVRALVKTGVCEKPRGAGYPQLLARDLRMFRRDAGETLVPLSRRLLEDPELLEDEIWRLFEHETDAFSFDWMEGAEGIAKDYETWPNALLRLSREGALDRPRLLDASLSALWTTTNSASLSGFRSFHERLEPTAEELSRREATYRELLGHKTAHVVGFALRQLTRLQKARGLGGEVFFISARPVFSLKPKAHPMAALRLVRKLAAEAGGLSGEATALLIDALRHPAADVQETAVGLLERHGDALDEASRSRLAQSLEEVAPLVRPRLGTLLGAEPRGDEHGVPEAGGSDLEALRADVEDLDGAARREFGLEGSDFSRLPSPPPSETMLRFALEGLPPIAPIESADELIDTVAHAIEVVDSADEIERIVAAIAWLGADRPAGFESRTAPLQKRLESATDSSQGLGAWGVPLGLRSLVASWLAGTRREPRLAWVMPPSGPPRFMNERLRELLDTVGQCRPYLLLSAPTHARGWIDPSVLVERMAQAAENRQPVLEGDMTQALLRLAPIGRQAALQTASALDGPAAGALRFALGDGDRIEETHGASPAWWMAAARSRWPREDLSERVVGLPGLPDWPDLRRPAAHSWTARIRKTTVFGRVQEAPALEIETTPGLPADPEETMEPTGISVALGAVARGLSHLVQGAWARARSGRLHLRVAYPTSLPHEPLPRMLGEWGLTPWLIDWQAFTWPANADGLFIRGVRKMMLRIDADSSVFEPHHAFLNPLFDRWRAWTEPANLALCVGLVSRDADARRLAVDAVIEGIQDGRADPQALGTVLARLSQGGWLKINRLAEGLDEASRVSSLHRLVVARILERFLEGQTNLPRNSHLILRLLNECQVNLGSSSPESLRETLRQIRTGGQTGRLARLLSERDEPGPGPGEHDALHAAWTARVRWARTRPAGPASPD